MDRIESVNDSDARLNPQQGAELHPLRPTSYTRNRTLSSSSRRPSIRIQRRPSASSFETNNSQQPQQPQQRPATRDRRSAGATDSPNLEEEAYQGSRRRSSSEPRPGRWSAPNLNSLSRAATRDIRSPMLPLTEESSNLSPVATTPQNSNAQLLEPPPAVPRGNILRRTSEAALNRFSRNRASTVSGTSPQPDRSSEYDSRLVDVLDVIGKSMV